MAKQISFQKNPKMYYFECSCGFGRWLNLGKDVVPDGSIHNGFCDNPECNNVEQIYHK